MTWPRMSRRHFLGVSAGAAAAGILAACSDDRSDGESLPDDSGFLSVLNWSDYIDLDVVSQFRSDTGIEVTYDDTYGSNEDFLAGSAGQAVYGNELSPPDIVVPTYWLVERLLADDVLQPLPLEHIANHVNIDPAYLTMPWDRGARWHMPWQAGITGIAYDPALTGREIDAVSDLFADEFAGQVGLMVEMRESVGLVMLMNGDDPTRATPETAHAALDVIEDAVRRGHVAGFEDSSFADKLAAGTYVACLGWSGDAALLKDERPDLEFVVPEEGGIRWFDSMVIPRRASNPRAAAEWMNYMYDPETAATIAAAVQYISPVVDVRETLEARGGEFAELAGNGILFPDDDVRRRLYVWGGMDRADEIELESRFNGLLS